MSDQVDAARRLYDAMAARDVGALLAAMDEDFAGTVSEGMPLGLGGRHEGRERMVRDVWANVFAAYDVTPEITRYIETGGPELVAIGRYVGTGRATGHGLDAAFAHVLTIRNGRVAALEQVTDTLRWHEAADGAHWHEAADGGALARGRERVGPARVPRDSAPGRGRGRDGPAPGG